MVNGNIINSNMACNNGQQLFQLDSWIRSSQSIHGSDDNNDNLNCSIVIAEQDIPCGLHSLPTCRPIPVKKILNDQHQQPKHLIKAYISELGIVSTRGHTEWIHMLRLAENCFEQNLIVHWDIDQKSLLVTTIKTIETGEELKAWFTPDLLNFLNIPFLSPSNIVNISHYQCNYCETTFNQPNPLKIHIALDCPSSGSQSSSGTSRTITGNHHRHPHLHQPSSNVSLTNTGPYGPSSMVNSSLASLILTSKSINSISNSMIHYSMISAMVSAQLNQSTTAVNTQSSSVSQSLSPPLLNNGTNNKMTLNGNTTSSSSLSSSSLSSLSSQENLGLIVKETPEALNQHKHNHSPQPPSVVTTSTLFGTKEPRSHICVFCGKLYTRKYGLKIHLRTHTGHKPLSCRFCGRPFSDPSNLNKHIRLHSQHHSGAVSSPYKCKKCSKILVRRRDLERHLKSRHKL